MTDEEKNELLKAGYSVNQVYEICQGREAGLDTSVYEHKEFYAIQMREIRLGLADGVDVKRFASPEYDWFQMQQIREGLTNGVNIDAYSDPSISYDRMHQVRLGLEQGVDLSKYVKLDAGILKQLRKAYIGKVNILDYIKKGYAPDQLEEIRVSLEKGLKIEPYITPELRGMAIRQICEGLADGVDVTIYAKAEYDWRQMQEIRLGLENRVDVSWYISSMYGWQQMREIRIGLEEGLDVSVYKSLMYTAPEMRKRRLQLEETGADPLQSVLENVHQEAEKKTVFADFAINIINEEMEAYVMIHKPGTRLKRAELQQALREHGISRGIDNKMLARLEQGGVKNTMVKVAEGRKPQDGEDGWYEYFFRTDVKRSPKVLEDGSVDYREIDWYEVVQKNQKLAVYHDAKNGVNGYTVKGRMIHAKKGREKKILTGHGFHVEEDGKTYISDLDGKIELLDERIEISRVLIMQEVSLASGNVNFDGTVHVLGDVAGGSRIVATENVIVDGYVEDAIIESNGDVILKKGMNASGAGGYIRAKNVLGGFFESAKVRAQEDIRADYCMNCDLYAEGQILITGANGSLMGGTSCAMGGIRVDNLGNPAGIATHVRLGINDGIVKQQKEIQVSIAGVNQELKILRNAYAEFTVKYTAEERNGMEMFLKIESAIYTKEMEMEKLQQTKLQIEQTVAQLKAVRAVVSNMLYEGVDIDINGLVWHSREVKNVTIRNMNSRLIVHSNT